MHRKEPVGAYAGRPGGSPRLRESRGLHITCSASAPPSGATRTVPSSGLRLPWPSATPSEISDPDGLSHVRSVHVPP